MINALCRGEHVTYFVLTRKFENPHAYSYLGLIVFFSSLLCGHLRAQNFPSESNIPGDLLTTGDNEEFSVKRCNR